MKTSEVKEYRDRLLGPARNAARRWAKTADGKTVLDTLERVFCRDVLARTGGVLDVNETLVRAGAMEVVQYLRNLAEEDEGKP
jgi:hypothetical protein